MRSVLVLVLVVVLTGTGLLVWRQLGGGELGSEGWSVTRVLPSPFGPEVAFLGTPRQGDVFRTHLVLAGDEPREISPPGVQSRSFAWMPDGEALLLAYGDDLGSEHPTRLAVVSADGSVMRRIELDREGIVDSGIAISPDGLRALMPAREMSPFVGATELWEVDLESGTVEVIAPTGGSSQAQAWPTYLSESHAVLSSGEPMSSTVGPNGWIGTVDLRSGAVARLTPEGETADFPSVAPGGDFIVFESFPGNERSRRGLWYVPVDGSTPPGLLIEYLPGHAAVLDRDGRSVLVIDAGSPGDRSVIRRLDVPASAPWLSD